MYLRGCECVRAYVRADVRMLCKCTCLIRTYVRICDTHAHSCVNAFDIRTAQLRYVYIPQIRTIVYRRHVHTHMPTYVNGTTYIYAEDTDSLGRCGSWMRYVRTCDTSWKMYLRTCWITCDTRTFVQPRTFVHAVIYVARTFVRKMRSDRNAI
jgi:hypothetical protein